MADARRRTPSTVTRRICTLATSSSGSGTEAGPGRELWRSFAGPVAAIGDVEHRRERGDWVTLTLADGVERELKTHEWLTVHCACPTR